MPDFATEDAVLQTDFIADLTDFFAAATFPLLLAGFLAPVFFDRAGLRAMESSSQWFPRIIESPGAQGEKSARAMRQLGDDCGERRDPSCVGDIIE